MSGLHLRAVGEASLVHLQVRDRLNPALFSRQPDEPGNRPHGLNHSLKETTEKIGLSSIAFGELLNLTDQRTNLLPGLFD
jgi:hypothetical protein